MRLSQYMTVLVVIAILGIWVVGLHVERVRAGHRIHYLDGQHRELLRAHKALELQFEAEATPEKLRERAQRMGLIASEDLAGPVAGGQQ